MAKLSREEAIKFLLNAPPEKAFWVNNGPVLKSVIELANAAKKLTTQQFMHHVNSAKNDFAKWIDEVIRDSELAKQLRRIKSKDEFAHILTNRLRQLQKMLK